MNVPDRRHRFAVLFLTASTLVATTLNTISTAANRQEFPIPKSIPTTPGEVDRVRSAAEQGDSEGEFALCFAYFSGLGGVPADAATALNWCQKASAQGSDSATVLAG